MVAVDLTKQGKGKALATPEASAAPGAASSAPAPAEAAPAEPEAAEEPLPQDRSIFQTVTGSTAVTGFGPSILEGIQGITGQVGVNVAKAEQLVLRKNMGNMKRTAANTLVPNERFPQVQVDFILKSADFSPEANKDRRTLISSIVAFDASLEKELRQATDDSRDNSLPQKVRIAQAANAAALRNMRTTLGVPEGLTPKDIEAIPEPTKGTILGIIDFVKGLVSGDTIDGDAVVPSLEEINNLSPEEVRTLVDGLPPETQITNEQAEALKKKLAGE